VLLRCCSKHKHGTTRSFAAMTLFTCCTSRPRYGHTARVKALGGSSLLMRCGTKRQDERNLRARSCCGIDLNATGRIFRYGVFCAVVGSAAAGPSRSRSRSRSRSVTSLPVDRFRYFGQNNVRFSSPSGSAQYCVSSGRLQRCWQHSHVMPRKNLPCICQPTPRLLRNSCAVCFGRKNLPSASRFLTDTVTINRETGLDCDTVGLWSESRISSSIHDIMTGSRVI